MDSFAHKSKGLKHVSRAVHDGNAQPLLRVKRPWEGPAWEPPGSLASNLPEVDAVGRFTCGASYAGNLKYQKANARDVMEEYKDGVYQFKQEFKVEPITVEDVLRANQKGKQSVGGVDHWRPAEFADLGRAACQRLAAILNLIEKGAPWPKRLAHAKAAFLAKDQYNPYDTPAYRVLMISPTLYRNWATIRLAALKPWMQGWECEEMFAGIPSWGAEDAWMDAALYLEEQLLEGNPVSLGAIDIYKSFDQLSRPLVYAIAKEACMPK